ncbi:MAG: hypothetical protein R3276_06645, partial [Marinobacter sp.]|nr:hypothetical protein [Marinobacter sp.]
DDVDNCPDTANAGQEDVDGDGIGDACDPVDNTGEDAYACGTAAAAPFKPFQEPAASASGNESILCLEGCVQNADNVVDANLLNTATLQSTLLGGAELTVNDAIETYEAPNRLGIAIADADALLSVSLLSTINVVTRLDGADQESFTDLTLAELDLLGLINDESVGYLIFDTAQDFDEVEISLGGVNVLESIDVFAVCASPDAL